MRVSPLLAYALRANPCWKGWGTLSRFSEPPRRNWRKLKELCLVIALKSGGGESGCMTLFDHAAWRAVRRSLGFAGDQVVDQQLHRIERFRAAAVQPEREDLADDPVAFRSGGAPRLVAQGQDAFSVVLIEVRT